MYGDEEIQYYGLVADGRSVIWNDRFKIKIRINRISHKIKHLFIIYYENVIGLLFFILIITIIQPILYKKYVLDIQQKQIDQFVAKISSRFFNSFDNSYCVSKLMSTSTKTNNTEICNQLLENLKEYVYSESVPINSYVKTATLMKEVDNENAFSVLYSFKIYLLIALMTMFIINIKNKRKRYFYKCLEYLVLIAFLFFYEYLFFLLLSSKYSYLNEIEIYGIVFNQFREYLVNN